MKLEDMELEAFKEVKSRRSEGSKPHSTPSTLAWLDENYELAEGVCIPRSSLYFHYMDFCEKTDTIPVNAASFGKIIRQQFSQLTTRRLGTRGQSKYHYYGIAIKESSVYYEAIYSKSGAPGVGSESTKKDAAKQNIAYSPRSKLGTLLPEFPDIRDINLPPSVSEAKVSTFIMMYRTHCQRILDTVIRANFDEVQNYLLHFWQGMPSHIIPILGSTAVVNIVGVCDSILYKAIASVLMPSVLQALPDSLTQVIRKFAYELDDWLKFALSNLPENLRLVKFQVSKGFTELLKLQTSLNHLCQASKTVIHNSDIVSQMLEDWELVDFPGILQQTMYTLSEQKKCEDIVHLIVNFYQEFECLLDDHVSIESYTEWLDSIINRCIVMPSTDNSGRLEKLARCFLLNWSSVSTRIIRDLTLHSAPSFGSYHLMHLMFDDYVTYTIGLLLAQSRAIDLKESLKRQTFVEMKDNQLTSNNKFGTSSSSWPNSNFSANVFKGKNMLHQVDVIPPNHVINNTPPCAPFNKVGLDDSEVYDYTFYPYAAQVQNEHIESIRPTHEHGFSEVSTLRKRERKRKNRHASMQNNSSKDNMYQVPYERNTDASNMQLIPDTVSEHVKRFRHTGYRGEHLNNFGSEQNGAPGIKPHMSSGLGIFQERESKLKDAPYLEQFTQMQPASKLVI